MNKKFAIHSTALCCAGVDHKSNSSHYVEEQTQVRGLIQGMTELYKRSTNDHHHHLFLSSSFGWLNFVEGVNGLNEIYSFATSYEKRDFHANKHRKT